MSHQKSRPIPTYWQWIVVWACMHNNDEPLFSTVLTLDQVHVGSLHLLIDTLEDRYPQAEITIATGSAINGVVAAVITMDGPGSIDAMEDLTVICREGAEAGGA